MRSLLPWLLPVAAYLYGSTPWGFLMARHFRGVDLREVGSGNIGATNAARVLGFRFFPVVFALDFTKGFLPALAALQLAGAAGGFRPPPLAVAAAAGGIIGHIFPLYLHFRGGKAVAAGAGAFVVLAPWAVAGAAVTWGVLFGLKRYVSLASIGAAVVLAASSWFLVPTPSESVLLGGETTGLVGAGAATLAGLAVVLLHRANIRRLLSGAEHRIGERRAAPADEPPPQDG